MTITLQAVTEHNFDAIIKRPGATVIYICYLPKNPVAKAFDGSLGFVETGLDEDGEMIAEIRLDGACAAPSP
ncbi:hypothetical protein [Massilia scottii]|uniref:hypothetical protein n=1 Tax=Massilia scottii TaxID=3057166 RepID=UPI002796B08E|nr:hypothetical protein [Massilia sp. CCM 9029]MDQ1831907.1 hypothetical protein [Massilia sp. CCM 9029]